jgi:hypothetical protein
MVVSLEGYTGYKKGFTEYGIVDGDGGIMISTCPSKEYADVIASKLNGKPRKE